MKVIDLRISKLEVCSSPKSTKNNYIYDGTTYMVFEMLKNKYQKNDVVFF